MTNKEAIEMIASMGKYMSSGNPIWKTEPVKEATDMAIEALKEKNRSDSLVRDDAENCKESESKLDLISRQDAIEAIEEIAWYHQNRNREMVSGANSDEDQAWYKAQDIYTALEALPSAEPVIHGRLIDADALSEKLCKTTVFIKDGEVFQRMINDAPTVSAEPKTGEWEFATAIPIRGGAYSAGYRCSNCGANYFNVEDMSFCPNCGARMDKGGDSE